MFRQGKLYEDRAKMESAPWLGKMEPFRLFGDTYFVGTYQASCHLIDTGAGLVMIDPGYANTAYLVMDSIHRLGFEPRDIKYIINTHWHWDHTEATAGFAALSGAKTLLGMYDKDKASQYFTPDILVSDGDTLTLGNKAFRFLHTPGHTAGTISLFYEDGGYTLGMFGGAGLNTLVPNAYDFAGAREAYFASLARLREIHVDVMLGNHTWNNDTYGKWERMTATGENPFLDPTLWVQFLDDYKARLAALIARES